MRKLSRLLKIEHAHAVGIMDMLWAFTADVVPGGNIGKVENIDIAAAVGWRKDPEVLVAALLESRWIDESEEHRFLIHDWWEHCEDSVHMKLARAGELFSDGRQPKLSRLPLKDKAKAEATYAALSVRTLSALSEPPRVPARERHGNGNGNGNGKGIGLGSAEGGGAALYARYQDFIDLWGQPCECCGSHFALKQSDLGGQQWMLLVDGGKITEDGIGAVFEGLRRYRSSEQWHKNGGDFVPSVPVFLGASKNGFPSAPLWNDRPTPRQAPGTSEESRF